MAKVPAATVASFLTVKWFINGVLNGFSESFQLIASTMAAADPVVQLLVNARARLLSKEHAIYDVVISSNGGPADGYEPYGWTAVGQKVDSETTIGACQNPAVGINFKTDTGQGNTAGHIIRGIRSSWVAGSALTFTPTAPFAQNFAVTAPYITYKTATPWNTSADTLTNYLCLVRDLTALYLPSVATPGQFDQYKFDLTKGGGYTIPAGQQIVKRAVGQMWPRTRGRKPAYA